MLSRNMQDGALITREAYLALLDLKCLVELAVEKAHTAGLNAVGLTVSLQAVENPLDGLKIASDALGASAFEIAVSDARAKIDRAIAWHKDTTH